MGANVKGRVKGRSKHAHVHARATYTEPNETVRVSMKFNCRGGAF
jgi:hypothetical protein